MTLKPLAIKFILISSLLLSFIITNVSSAKALVDDSLSDKIAINYADKYCNALGIGMAKESALKLSILENKEQSYNPSMWLLMLSKDKDRIETVDNNILANKVLEKIQNKCNSIAEIRTKAEEDEFEIEFLNLKNNMAKG